MWRAVVSLGTRGGKRVEKELRANNASPSQGPASDNLNTCFRERPLCWSRGLTAAVSFPYSWGCQTYDCILLPCPMRTATGSTHPIGISETTDLPHTRMAHVQGTKHGSDLASQTHPRMVMGE